MPELNTFKEALLDRSGFCVTWEQVAGRGAGKGRERVLTNVSRVVQYESVKAISVTDNPGGSPAYAAGALGAEIKKMGGEPLVHLALRDKNRSELESQLYALDNAGVRNLLIVSGDYPDGAAQPVFDLEPTHALQLIQRLNTGLEYEFGDRIMRLSPTDFFAGAAFSPFKKLEAELMCQYYKLAKKIGAGAQFIICQVGYDARKAQEPLLWLEQNGYTIPVLANIYVLSYRTACLMYTNKIPGCVVSEKLLGELESECRGADGGREARIVRAAKMYAIAKGLGYRGVHIGGHGLVCEDIQYIIQQGEELAPGWQGLVAEFDYPQPDGFYLFSRDKESGLNTTELAPMVSKGRKSAVYDFSQMVHRTLLEPTNPLFGMYQKLAGWIDHTRVLKRFSLFLEHLNKSMLFDCAGCGDCALAETGYLCPVSQCPKGTRTGPCGGSYNGWCELYPEVRRCIWVKAYERLKGYDRLDVLCATPPPPRDWSLNRTSAWLNFYMGRDHTAKRLGLTPPGKHKK